MVEAQPLASAARGSGLGGEPAAGVGRQEPGSRDAQGRGLARSITVTWSLLEGSGAVPGAWAEVGGLGTEMDSLSCVSPHTATSCSGELSQQVCHKALVPEG